MKVRKYNLESGQSLVLFTLLIFAFIGMLALALDGGYGLYQRRIAQNAADAGALAGASVFCNLRRDPDLSLSYVQSEAIQAALEYVQRNQAASSVGDIQIASTLNITGTIITVPTHITYDSFFGGVLGIDQVTVRASASAGCFAPSSGTGVLPVAWSCGPPALELPTMAPECTLETTVVEPEPDMCSYEDGDPIYIITDSRTVTEDVLCQSAGGWVNCDINGDGTDDVHLLSGGMRSWLDLTGEGSTPIYRSWIRDGFPDTVRRHTWAPGDTGVVADLYGTIHDYRLHDITIVPIFDIFCSQGDRVSCINAHRHPEDVVEPDGTTISNDYFHIIDFALFYVKCVEAQSHSCGEGTLTNYLKGLPNNERLSPSIKTVEGCFVEGYVPGLDGRGDPNTSFGAYIPYLIR